MISTLPTNPRVQPQFTFFIEVGFWPRLLRYSCFLPLFNTIVVLCCKKWSCGASRGLMERALGLLPLFVSCKSSNPTVLQFFEGLWVVLAPCYFPQSKLTVVPSPHREVCA
jgi:hypothetical protein